MEPISLSIEELIYCFYSEGYFEQGNALKQVYFGDLEDEKMDLLLQITCRSLLAKKLVSYENHKFTLSEDLVSVISTLNYSEQTIKASRHADGGKGEEQLSFHIGEKGIIKHALMFDEMVHEFSFVTLEDVSEAISEYYRIENSSENNHDAFQLTQNEFEQLLLALTDNRSKFEMPLLKGEKKQFNDVLEKTNGLLNTLLFLKFNENKEPYATNIVMFTNSNHNNWMIEKKDDIFQVQLGSARSVDLLIQGNITAFKGKEEELTHG
ncbi:hypothetical protein A8F94_18640 [Bacillus sp. FJAT-27225]|uniref:hypothetical protein n=1 Tax=Bacillus sp. FJAT-27225 TaxID=1743144 RepID=UPI00080C209C|nr:hypothetical protein [Bacillus sp. FJAT-27225]OCA83144.1 hypothetical protein A8F94_18640 [Bacillus sp. FJAT-27225]